eukprot:g19299.t1
METERYLTSDQLTSLVLMADKNSGGLVDYEEFAERFSGSLCPKSVPGGVLPAPAEEVADATAEEIQLDEPNEDELTSVSNTKLLKIAMIDDEDEAAAEVGCRFHVIQKLGEGTYGKVYKATCKGTLQVFALKRIPIVMDEDGV